MMGAPAWPRWLRALLGMAGWGPGPAAVRAVVDGQLVVITGASRGIGAQIARRLAHCGAHVVLLARTEADLAAVSGQIRARGGMVSTYPVDLREADAAGEVGELILAEHGTPAVVISNAGHSIHRPLLAYTDRYHDVARLAGVNMLGPIALLLPVLEAMSVAGRGHLISVASTSVDIPAPGWSAYGATKTGFEAWLAAIAPELAAAGVATTSVHLPLVHTAMSAPNPRYARAPGLRPAEAASLLCHAVVRRPRLICPWWSRLGGVFSTLFPGLIDRLIQPLARAEVARAARERQ